MAKSDVSVTSASSRRARPCGVPVTTVNLLTYQHYPRGPMAGLAPLELPPPNPCGEEHVERDKRRPLEPCRLAIEYDDEGYDDGDQQGGEE